MPLQTIGSKVSKEYFITYKLPNCNYISRTSLLKLYAVTKDRVMKQFNKVA